MSKHAMKIGEQNVRQAASSNISVSFIYESMLSFVKKAPSSTYNFVFSSLAIHHLQDKEKEQLIREIRRILKPNGSLMIIDLFLKEDEDRSDFLRRGADNVRNNWIKLNSMQVDLLLNYAVKYDFPAKFSTYKHWASMDPPYKNVTCFESTDFCKTVVFEID